MAKRTRMINLIYFFRFLFNFHLPYFLTVKKVLTFFTVKNAILYRSDSQQAHSAKFQAEIAFDKRVFGEAKNS